MKRLLLVGLSIMLFIAALIFAGQTQWGAVTIAFGEVRYTINFAVFALALIGVFVAAHMLSVLFGLPSRLMSARRARRHERLREEFDYGIDLYLQRRWEQAGKCFSSAARIPAFTYAASLFAARCAVEDGHFEMAREALQAAREVNVKDDFCTLLIHSEILLKSGQPEQAAEHLDTLRRRQPGNYKVADLLVRACETVENWRLLADALPQLRGMYARQPDRLRAIEVPVARAMLQRAAKRGDEGVLERQWRQISAEVKPVLYATYARLLMSVGAREMAERVLHEVIEANWDEDCLVYYGDIEGGDIDERIKHAEQWLKNRPKDPALLLCLGKLYRQAKLWDRARHCLKASLNVEPRPETFKELVTVFDHIGGGGNG